LLAKICRTLEISVAEMALFKAHRVRKGETLAGVAKSSGITWQELAQFNWGTADPDKINERLRDEVGCTRKTRDGWNYVFDDSDHPGIIFIPTQWEQKGLAADRTHTIRVRSRSRFFVILENDAGLRIPDVEYEAMLADGSKHSGQLGRGGVDAIENPPKGPVEIKFLDLDDIESKSLAANVRKALDDRDPREIHRLFRYPDRTVRRVFEAYDKYFNDYHGKGLRNDLESEFSSDPDALMVLNGHFAYARMLTSAQLSAEET
jgi:hypothetical protein